jgi:cephalosporin hydroxylase
VNPDDLNAVRNEVYKELVVRPYHDLLFRTFSATWPNWYRGHHILKIPMDLWSYSELIAGDKPEVIVETGSYEGGSALYFADQQLLAGLPRDVISIDIARPDVAYPGVRFIEGSSTDPEIVELVHKAVGGRRCLVVLDSDHSTPHVAAELDAYHDLVEPGQHLVVEDTNTQGPAMALGQWLAYHADFVSDIFFERWAYLTFHPGGWLRRAAPGDTN